MFKKLRTVIYHVDDIVKTKEWYKNVTAIEPYFDQPFYVGFEVNGCELGFDPNMNSVEKGNQSVAYWSVENIEDVVNKLTLMNATVISAITDVGDGIKVTVLKILFWQCNWVD